MTLSLDLAKVPATLAFVTVIAACGGEDAGSEGDVPWGDYASDLRQRIDAATDAQDCAELQAEFDAADANSDATMTRTGHNNADLMGYIDDAMRDAGCKD